MTEVEVDGVNAAKLEAANRYVRWNLLFLLIIFTFLFFPLWMPLIPYVNQATNIVIVVITGQFAFNHLLQTDQRIAHVFGRLGFQQLGHVGQPVVGVKTDAGAAAAQQHAMQFGGRARVAAGAQQFGKSVVRGILNRHDELGARRRDV